MPRDIDDSIRRIVIERAGSRCEYCLIDQDSGGFSHQIDHIISRKHGGSSRLGNLAYSCVVCNRRKGSDIAGTDHAGRLVRLFDPRRDAWRDHFRISGSTVEPLTSVGEATVRVLRLNAAERVVERRLLQAIGRYPKQ